MKSAEEGTGMNSRPRAYVRRMMRQDKRSALLAVGEEGGGGGHYLDRNNIVEWRSHPKTERPDRQT